MDMEVASPESDHVFLIVILLRLSERTMNRDVPHHNDVPYRQVPSARGNISKALCTAAVMSL